MIEPTIVTRESAPFQACHDGRVVMVLPATLAVMSDPFMGEVLALVAVDTGEAREIVDADDIAGLDGAWLRWR